MIDLWLNIIVLIFSTLLIINVKKIPNNIIIYDYPDNDRKIHTFPVPLLGGLIFFFSLILNIIIFYDELNIGFRLLISFLFLSSFFFSLGTN